MTGTTTSEAHENVPTSGTDEGAALSARFRDETREAHERAEHSPFMSELLDGRRDVGAWLLLLEQLAFVYAAIERTADRFRGERDEPALLDPALDRGPAIAADVAALRARTGTGPAAELPETAEYVRRIEEAGDEFGRFIAHHYTRYLGDLSGGQSMRVWLDRHYGLPDDEAAFFRFDGIEKAPVFKKDYRAALDALDLDEDAAARAVAETSVAFESNERLFAGVRRALEGA